MSQSKGIRIAGQVHSRDFGHGMRAVPHHPISQNGNFSPERIGRILVVEDERHIARFLEYVLQKAGYEVAVAEDGKRALQVLPDFCPDGMILDLVLPEISGPDLLKLVRMDRKFARLVIIVVSAHWFGEDDQNLRDAGATAQCSKPIAPSTLLGKLLELGIRPLMPAGLVA